MLEISSNPIKDLLEANPLPAFLNEVPMDRGFTAVHGSSSAQLKLTPCHRAESTNTHSRALEALGGASGPKSGVRGQDVLGLIRARQEAGRELETGIWEWLKRKW